MIFSSNAASAPTPSLEKLTAKFERNRPKLHLDEAACRYFGCEQDVAASSLEGLGPVVTSPGPRVTLGKWISTQACQLAREGFWGLALEDHSWIDAVVVSGDVTMFLDRPGSPADEQVSTLVHRMRNQLNAIQINAELLTMIAQSRDDDQIGKPAARVLNNAHLLLQTLEQRVDCAGAGWPDACDLGETLKSNFFRNSGSKVKFDHMPISVSLAYCTSIVRLMMQWLAFERDSERGCDPIRLAVDPEAETIKLEATGLDPWVAHSLSSMVDWLHGCDASIAPTRAFRDTGLGCGYWRDGRAAGAEFGYRQESR
ncbi:MAG TPA: hypothetical protein VGC50_06465 [Gammaproteobacteria bacterium]